LAKVLRLDTQGGGTNSGINLEEKKAECVKFVIQGPKSEKVIKTVKNSV